MEPYLFYSFACLATLAAIGVVFARSPVKAVLFLVLTFVATAAIWLSLQAEFLAITLVLVYVGAVMVLFLFVVMMLDLEMPFLKSALTTHLPIGLIIAGVVTGLLFLMTGSPLFNLDNMPWPPAQTSDFSNVKALGQSLYTNHLLPFEVAGVILLVAIIAAIALAFRGAQTRFAQSPGAQVQVKKSDRLKIIRMKPHQDEKQ